MDFTRSFFPPNGFRFKSLISPGMPLYLPGLDKVAKGLGKKAGPPDGPVAAPPPPPATASSVEVQQAKTDAKQQAQSKQGISSTILAGDNPFEPTKKAGAKNTVLGGG